MFCNINVTLQPIYASQILPHNQYIPISRKVQMLCKIYITARCIYIKLRLVSYIHLKKKN